MAKHTKASTELRLERMEKAIREFREQVLAYSPDHLREMEARHRELSESFRILIDRVSAVTEVTYSARHNKRLTPEIRAEILGAASWALSTAPDSMFTGDEAEKRTVAEWSKVILKAYRTAKAVGDVEDLIG